MFVTGEASNRSVCGLKSARKQKSLKKEDVLVYSVTVERNNIWQNCLRTYDASVCKGQMYEGFGGTFLPMVPTEDVNEHKKRVF